MTIPIENYKLRQKQCIDKMKQITGGKKACMILYSSPERLRNGDNHYRYRFSSDVFFMTGIKESETITLLRTEPPYSVAFVLPKDPQKEVWTGIRRSTEQIKHEHQLDEVYTTEDIPQKLIELLEESDHLFVSFIDREMAMAKLNQIIQSLQARYRMNPDISKELQEIYKKDIYTDSSKADQAFIDKVKKLKEKRRPGISYPRHLHDAHNIISELRRHKTKDEIEAIRYAVKISEKAYIETIPFTKPGMNENDVLTHLEYGFKKYGGDDVGYGSIVAGGENATILHYTLNDKPLLDNTLLLIDAGAEKNGYTADISRTYPVGKKFTSPQKDVYNAVLEIQNKLIDMVKPGISIHELNEESIKLMIQALIDLKVLKGNVETHFMLDSHNPFYMHGIGHFLGLDVHDVGSYYSGLDTPEPLKPGAVLTIEPGLYFGKIAEKYTPKEFYGIGVRIEDNIVVTEDGHENLVTLARSVEDLENMK